MSLFPFSLPVNKDTLVKRRELDNSSAQKYELQLTEYREMLERYKRCIVEYADKLEGLDNRAIDQKLTIMKTTLDLTYIKEQTDKTIELIEKMRTDENTKSSEQENRTLTQVNKLLEQIEGLSTAVIMMNDKIEGLDKNVVNRLSDVIIELHKQTLVFYKQSNQELQENLNNLAKSVGRSKLILWFLFFFQLIGLGAFAFIIMYLLELIVI